MNGLEELALRFTQAAAQVLWIGALVALGVVVAERLVARSAAARHAAHLVGLLLTLAALPLAFLMMSDTPTSAPVAGSGRGVSGPPTAPAGAERFAPPVEPAPVVNPDSVAPTAASEPGEVAGPVAVDAPPVHESGELWATLAPWVAGGYALGLAMMALRLFCGFAGSMRLRGRSEPVGQHAWSLAMRRMANAVGVRCWPALQWSREVAAPVVMGFLKPAILLPVALASRLSPAQVEAMLAHELAHLQRRDTWAVAVQRIAETVLFFHPAVWWMSRRMESAREEACDDLVVAAGCDPADYAEALLICSECRLEQAGLSARLATRLASTGKGGAPLRQRVLRLLGQGDRGSVRLGRIGWVLGLLAVGGVALAVTVDGLGRGDLADFDFGDPPTGYEEGIEVADRNQRFEVDGLSFRAGPLRWEAEGWMRLPEERQGPGEELFLNLGASGGYEIVEFRLFDHATRRLLHDSAWQHSSETEAKFHVERVGATNWVRLRETGGVFPARIDVWLRLVRNGTGEPLVLAPADGASATRGGSEIVVTSVFRGTMDGDGQGPSGKMIWLPKTLRDEDRKFTVNLENRGAVRPGRHHLVAVLEDGTRRVMDDLHFRDFSSQRHQYVRMDAALDDVVHLEWVPFAGRHKFFFNGLEVPRGELPELAPADARRIDRWKEDFLAGELSKEDFRKRVLPLGPGVVPKMVTLMDRGRTDVFAVEVIGEFLDDPRVTRHLVRSLRSWLEQPPHRMPNAEHCCLVLLGKAGNREHVELVGRFLGRRPNAAIPVLGMLGGDAAAARLADGFDEVPTEKWWLVAGALREIGEPTAVPELKRRLARVEAPPSERFGNNAVGVFVEAIRSLEQGDGGEPGLMSWQQGQHFVYPYDGPGSPKSFSVHPGRDHYVTLPQVDPASDSGRAAIWKAFAEATEGPGFTIDGDEVVLLNGLRAMPLWENGPPYPTTLHDWLRTASHRDLVRQARDAARDGRVAIPSRGALLALDPAGRMCAVYLKRSSEDFAYGVTIQALDPLQQLARPSPNDGPFTEWRVCTLHDLEAEAKDGALSLSRGHMLKMDQERWRKPGTDAVLVAEFAANRVALAVPGAEEFVLVEATRDVASGDLVRSLARARGQAPRIDGHERLERSGAVFHRFAALEAGQCFGIAVRMPGGFPVAGLLEVREIEGETLKLRTCFLRTELARGAFASSVDGVEVEWETVDFQPGEGEGSPPVAVLGFAVHNRGTHRLHLPDNGRYHQVEVDGRWYEWVDPRTLGEDGAEVSKGARLLDFDPGDSRPKQSIRLADHWRAIPEGREQDYAQRQLGGFAVRPEDYGERLVLEPGKHRLRIAVLCQPARAGLYRMIRGVSEARVVNVAAGIEDGTPQPDDLGEVYRRIERFARLPKDEQAAGLSGFYQSLPARSLSPVVEMILSSYPHHILEPDRDGAPFDGNTSLWAGQLAEAAERLSVEEVTDKLGRPVWIRVAARARALQVLEAHPDATSRLVAGDLGEGGPAQVERATSIIVSLQLQGFTDRLLELWLAEDERSPAAWSALVFLRDPSIVERLLERVATEPSFLTRCSGLFQGPLAGRAAEPALLALLDSEDPEIRYHAANALQECRDPRLAEPAVRLAHEEEVRFRLLAAQYVARLPDEAFAAARQGLLGLLDDESDEVRFKSLHGFAGRKDPAAGPVILEALQREGLPEQHKVWVMQSLSSLTDRGWHYDMHRWGPGSQGNREAIARFEAWLEEQRAGAALPGDGVTLVLGADGLVEWQGRRQSAEELAKSAGLRGKRVVLEAPAETPFRAVSAWLESLESLGGEVSLRVAGEGDAEDAEEAGAGSGPVNPLGVDEETMVKLFDAGKLMREVAVKACDEVLRRSGDALTIDELHADYRWPGKHVTDPFGGKLELRFEGAGEARTAQVWSRGNRVTGRLGVSVSRTGDLRWLLPDPRWEPYLVGARTSHWLRAMRPAVLIEYPLPDWDGDPLDYGPKVDGLRLAVELAETEDPRVRRLRFHFRNESEGSIQLANGRFIQDGLKVTARGPGGSEPAVQLDWHSGWTPVQRERIEPGGKAVFLGPTFGLADSPAQCRVEASRGGEIALACRVAIPGFTKGGIDGMPQARDWRGVLESGEVMVAVAEDGTVELAGAGRLQVGDSRTGGDDGLGFLRAIPEFRGLKLDLDEAGLREHIRRHELRFERTEREDEVIWRVWTEAGETVVVTFRDGECAGIQRMRPEPGGNDG